MPPRRWSGVETNFRRCLYKSDLVTSAGIVSAATRACLSLSFLLSLSGLVEFPPPDVRPETPLVPLTVSSSNSPLKPSQKGGQYLLDGF